MKLKLPSWILILLSIFIVACSNSSNNDGGSTTTTNVSGTAVKGVIANGIVSIYTINSSGAVSSSPITTTTTDASGNYTATLPSSYSGEALKIEITAGENTTMKCDINGSFCTSGAAVPLGSDFVLRAVVPTSTSSSISVHVNTLTEMAAAVADVGGTFAADAIANANTQIANLFQIPADITQIAGVDITDTAAVASATSVQERVALISAGVLSAVIAGAGDTPDLEDALNSFISTFDSEGGQLRQNDNDSALDSSVISLIEIVTEAQSLATKLQAAGADIGTALNDITTQLGILATKDDGFTSVDPSAVANASEITKAKSLVGDIRDIVNSTSLDSLGQFGDEIDSAFAEEVEMTQEITGMGQLFDAVAAGISAIYEAHSYYKSTTSFQTPFASETGLSVAIAESASGGVTTVTYTINQTVSGQTYALTGTVNKEFVSRTEIACGSGCAGDISLTGTVENSEGTFNMTSGSVSANATIDESVSATGRTETATVTIEASLGVTVAQKATTAVTDPITFTGSYSLTITNFMFTETSQLLSDNSSGSVSLQSFSTSLNGTFADTQDNSYAASLSVSVPTNQFKYSFENTSTDSTETEETAQNFLPVSASLSITASITGVDNDANVTLSAERTTFDAAVITLTISLDGETISIVVSEADNNVVISNQNDVQITLSEGGENSDSDVIMVNGTQVAEVSETDDGAFVVFYNDNTFESL